MIRDVPVNATRDAGVTGAPYLPDRGGAPTSWKARVAAFRSRTVRWVSLVHRIIGAPDYEGYVAHATRCHPDHPLLSRDDFVRQRQEDKYSRPGSRCC